MCEKSEWKAVFRDGQRLPGDKDVTCVQYRRHSCLIRFLSCSLFVSWERKLKPVDGLRLKLWGQLSSVFWWVKLRVGPALLGMHIYRPPMPAQKNYIINNFCFEFKFKFINNLLIPKGNYISEQFIQERQNKNKKHMLEQVSRVLQPWWGAKLLLAAASLHAQPHLVSLKYVASNVLYVKQGQGSQVLYLLFQIFYLFGIFAKWWRYRSQELSCGGQTTRESTNPTASTASRLSQADL